MHESRTRQPAAKTSLSSTHRSVSPSGELSNGDGSPVRFYISTAEDRIARATLERARARASSHERAAELGTFVSFFFFRLYTKLKHDHNRTTIHDFNLHQ